MALEPFHPLIARWFRDELGEPTEVQRLAWPRIAAGGHLLVSAPTGTGKTLTAFLWALDRLATGAWSGGRTRVLYVSPLKALNSDIERNLERPLAALAERFAAHGLVWPGLRTMTRSGDTPAADRRRMLRQPPEILITTPESLNLLLTSVSGRDLLRHLRTVILDEVHAIAGNKRGSHLATAVERLVPLAGEFQRLALSATVRPLAAVAAFVGGRRRLERAGQVEFEPRAVEILEVAGEKRYQLEVRALFAADEEVDAEQLWPRLAGELGGEIRRHRSSIVFTNSRRHAEQLARRVNEREGREVAWAHHGSLAREIRHEVEQRLKAGKLPAIVATNSLELGIDVGALEAVLLVQTPRSLASAIQRVGRSGHRVGEESRGIFYPLFARDLADAAVAVRGILERRVEPLHPVRAPLDVLAQVILSVIATESWSAEDLFDLLRCSEPYRTLSRRAFDLVVEMLAGRYAAVRIPELQPRLTLDPASGLLRARPGVARAVYQSGGTIPERGYFHLRHEGSLAKLGELDEEFVWERRIGDVLTLGAQSWRIRAITQADVLVAPAGSGPALAPFWRADERDREWAFSELLLDFLGECETRLDDAGFAPWLEERYRFRPQAAAALRKLLAEQRAATGELPGRHRLVLEHTGGGRDGRERVILHTGWGGRVNRPLSLALAALAEETWGGPVEFALDDDCVQLVVPVGSDVEGLLRLVQPERVEELLRGQLERSGFFGARFRANAGRALLLPRAGFRGRTPLWLLRQRAKELLAAVGRFGDFPIVLETWRTCLEDEFDLEALRRLLGELADGHSTLHVARTERPSPFAAHLAWKLTNELMYEDDVPLGRPDPTVKPSLLRELVFEEQTRPRFAAALIESVRRRLQRSVAEYSPSGVEELIDLVEERVALTGEEARELLAAMAEPAGDEAALRLHEVRRRLLRWRAPGGEEELIVAAGSLPLLAQAFALEAGQFAAFEESESSAADDLEGDLPAPLDPSPEARSEATARLFEQWLRCQAPLGEERVRQLFGWDRLGLAQLVEDGVEAGWLVVGRFRAGREAPELCHARTVELLLRRLRAANRRPVPTLPLEALPLFLADHQGLVRPASDLDGLRRSLERLFAWPAPAALWETELLPARLATYFPAWLDGLMAESDLAWRGAGRERLALGFPEDLALLDGGAQVEPEGDSAAARVRSALAASGPRTVEELSAELELAPEALLPALWALAWRGEVSNDGFLAVRRGLESDFAAAPTSATAGGARWGTRWSRTRPFPGRWRLAPRDEEESASDLLAGEERGRARARLVLARYGVVFRELLAHEAPGLQWRGVARALHRMELAGEIVAGHFFAGVPGLQFATPAALARLQSGLPERAPFWLSAVDPASLCGVELPALKGSLPRRSAGNLLAYEGSELALVASRGGRELELRRPADHPRLRELLSPLLVRLTRAVAPERALDVERINGEPATTSPYLAALERLFHVTGEPNGLRLRRGY